MGALEEQARFLTAKYGTAAHTTGFPIPSSGTWTLDGATIMVLVGLLLFTVILIALIREMQLQQTVRSVREP